MKETVTSIKERAIVKRGLKRVTASAMVLAVVLLCGNVLAAENGSKMQFYFVPQTMNDVTGEVVVDVNLRNFGIAVPKSMGDLCGFTFAFTYDDTQFDLQTDENGNIAVFLDDKTLVRAPSDLETAVDGNKITVDFMDGTLNERLICGDGTLFRFRLTAKNVIAMWNSVKYYPLRFVAGSVGAVTYRTDNATVGSCYSVEGIDGKVGAYYLPQAIDPRPVGKTFGFTQGGRQMTVGDEQIEMDVPVISLEGKPMIPLRFLAECAGMQVEWDGTTVSASASAECMTLKLFPQEGKTYVNSMPLQTDMPPVVIDGRTYISAETIKAVWHNAEVSGTTEEISVCLP